MKSPHLPLAALVVSMPALLTAKDLVGDPLPSTRRAIGLADKSGDGKPTLAKYLPLDVQALHHGEEHFTAGDAIPDGFLDIAELAASLPSVTENDWNRKIGVVLLLVSKFPETG